MSLASSGPVQIPGSLATGAVEAREIALCDREGRRRAVLAVRDDGVVALELLDAGGQARIEIEVAADGQARVVHRDSWGKPAATARAEAPPPVALAIRGPLASQITPLPEDVSEMARPETPRPRETPPPIEKPFQRMDSILP